MPLYLNKANDLTQLSEIPFKLEKDIQSLVEQNLESLFSLQFVASEFTIHDFRIDTLTFDLETKAFVIIEYKKVQNYSVVDQGMTYLSKMLNNKADFVLEYNEVNPQNQLKKSELDWSQSRVMFVSPSFTNYQKESINFKDLPIELWEIKQFENGLIGLNQVNATGAVASIETVSKQNKEIQTVTREVKKYTENDLISGGRDDIVGLYHRLKNSILEMGNSISVKPTKLYVGFKVKSNFLDINVKKSKLKLWLNVKRGELDDPRHIAKDVSTTGHWGNGDYEIHMENDDQLEYILSLIKQSYKKNTLR